MSSADSLMTYGGLSQAGSSQTVQKVIIAVHGIGEQLSFATAQSVVKCFCEYYDQPAAVPLGMLHSAGGIGPAPPVLSECAFGEVYWAPVPRSVVASRYTLEEATAWARTLVERLQLQQGQDAAGVFDDRDRQLAGEILGEVIEAVTVLDRICFIADKAGVFCFDLKKLLDSFLGDVQIVTEYRTYREKILETFESTLAKAHDAYPGADIYIVAHSEGTVVSLLGLLQAFRHEDPPAWAKQMRGFMTIGSPIDKHLMLWPNLFDPAPPQRLPAKKIPWRNYYDHGDPIGYNLDSAREWLKQTGWNSVFDFEAQHDFGFSRYALPGKAHVDYWNDRKIFGHFIEQVVGPTRPATGRPPPRMLPCSKSSASRPDRPIDPTGDRLSAQIIAYAMPYLLVFAIIGAGSFVFVKAALGAIVGTEELADFGVLDIMTRVLPLAAVLLGLTVVGRVPRLTRNTSMQLVAWLIGLGGIALFAYFMESIDTVSLVLGTWELSTAQLVAGLAVMVVTIVYLAARFAPCSGVKPLLLAGVGGAILYVVLRSTLVAPAGELVRPIWPLVLATFALLYLWWLAVLLFDLSFVWHWYMRHDRICRSRFEQGGGTTGTDQGRSPPMRPIEPAPSAMDFYQAHSRPSVQQASNTASKQQASAES